MYSRKTEAKTTLNRKKRPVHEPYQINQSLSVCTRGRDIGIRINYLKKAGKCLNNLLVILVTLYTGYNTHVASEWIKL